MFKNYYDILEVNINASPEIIEKAYKLLIKRNHPDLQPENLKSTYEEKIKLINEAYETLSNPSKKSSYDKSLQKSYVSIEEYNKVCNENHNLRLDVQELSDRLNNINTVVNNQRIAYKKIGLSYKFKKILKFVIGITLLIIALKLAYFIPPIKSIYDNLYNNNIIIHMITNLFSNIFS